MTTTQDQQKFYSIRWTVGDSDYISESLAPEGQLEGKKASLIADGITVVEVVEVALTTYVAEFQRAAEADGFAGAIQGDGWYAQSISHQRGTRKVAWVGPATPQYRMDMAETVGFHGSAPLGPVATLDGQPTPRCY